MNGRLLATCTILAVATASVGYSDDGGFIVRKGDGESLLGGNLVIKVSKDTGSQGGLMVVQRMSGFTTGNHIHDHADEFFYVSSGRGEVLINDRIHVAEQGDIVFVPKGQSHELRNLDTTSTFEVVFVLDRPGAENQFREIDERISDGAVLTRKDYDEIARKYGARLVSND